MNNRTLLSVSLTILIAVAMLAFVAPAVSAQDAGEGNVNISLNPADGEVDQGEVQTYEVIVEDADNGIGAYELNVSVGDETVGEVTDYALTASDTDFDNSEISADNSTLTLEAALGNSSHDANNTDGAAFAIATLNVTAVGDAGQQTALTTSQVAGNATVAEPEVNGSQDVYNVTDFGSGSFSVAVGDDAINVTLKPDEVVSGPGGETNYSVVIEGATDGIEGYDNILIELEDPSVGNFTSFFETANNNDGGQGPLSKSQIRPSRFGNGTDEGPVLFLSASLLDKTFDGAEEITITEATVEATGDIGDLTTVNIVDESTEDSPPVLQDLNSSEYPVDQVGQSSYEISFDMNVDFPNQEVQAGNTVTVENVDSDDQNALVLLTYENDAGDLVVAGLAEGQFENEDVGITVDDTGGLTVNESTGAAEGEHTAHILPESQASGEYQPGDTVSGETAQAIIDQDSGVVTDPPIPDLTGLDIDITEGLTIGDDYPLNQRSIISEARSIYRPSDVSLPPEAEEPDQRYAPIANGSHTGLGGLPTQDEVYAWAEDLLSFQDDAPSQTVAVSFPADQNGTFALDYGEAGAHGLAIADASLDEFENINIDPTEDIGNNSDVTLDAANEQILINYSADDNTTSPTVQFSLVFAAENPKEGLDVDRPDSIDYETDHRIIAPDADQERENFVTFEVGATGISHADTNNANGGFLGENTDEVTLDSVIDTDGAADGTTNDGSFLVWQDQRVTFESQNLDDTIGIFETATETVEVNGSEQEQHTLGEPVSDDVVRFDDTAPGRIANLDTSDLPVGQYFVTFGQDQRSAVVLDVNPLNLEADSTDTVAQDEQDEPLEIGVTSDDTTGGNVEAWIAKEPVVEANDTSEVIHVERDQLTGEGDRTLEVIPSVDLDGPGDYTATVLHAESGVTTTTEFTISGQVADPDTPVEWADDVTIVSPSLEEPEEPGRFDRGDVIPVELELEGGNAATITFGNAENENVEVHASVYDTGYTQADVNSNADTNVTVYLSTYHIGHGYVNQNTADNEDLQEGYTSADLNLTLNSPPYITGAADNRSHGFFTEPADSSALIPADRLDRNQTVFAHGDMDIYGGSQSGAVLSAQVSYDFHAVADESELPYTLIGDDREEDRDDINFLSVEERSTENFQYWRAPGQGVNALDNRLPANTTTADIESLAEEGIITPLNVEDGEVTDQLAEDDFVIVQSESSGTEGVMLEAVLRNGLDVQEYVDTIQGDSVDEEISAEFDAANSINLDAGALPKAGEPGYAASSILDYQFSMVESPASVDSRFELTGPNVAEDEVSPIVPDRDRGEVVADLNFDQTDSTFYVPYQVTEDLPVPTGDTFAPELTFNVQTVFDVRGGAQAAPVFEGDNRSISLEDNTPLSQRNGEFTGASNVSALDYVQATVGFDGVHVDGGQIQVPTQNYTLTGTTTMAPGTEVNIRLLSDLDEPTPFLKTAENIVVEPQEDDPLSTWEATFDFAETRDDVEIIGGTEFEADIIRTGGDIVSGGDDIPGLVLEEPAVSTFEFNDQRSDGDVVSIAAFESNRAAQIVIEDDSGTELGSSDVLPRGELQEQFNVVLDQPLSSNQDVTAVAEFVQPDPAQFDDATLAEESASILIEDLSEPFFSVGELTPAVASVEVGAEVTVEATVENLGDQEGTQSVTLSAGDFSDSQTVTVSGQSSSTVSFTFNTDALGAGEYTHTVSTEDDQAAGSLTVEAQPDPGVLEIVSDSLSPMDATVTQGEEVVVSVSLQNIGETEVTEDVTLEVSGLGEVDSESVTLAAGATDSVSFTVDTTDVEAGDYTHTVSTAEDSTEGDLTIEAPEPDDDSDDNGTEEDGDDGSGPGFGIAVAALALLGAALLAMRRRVE
jgi:PGF-CTERM protein